MGPRSHISGYRWTAFLGQFGGALGRSTGMAHDSNAPRFNAAGYYVSPARFDSVFDVRGGDRHSVTYTPEETRSELASMTTRELTAYRNILRMPALRSPETRALNALHLGIVEELLKDR